MFLIFFCFRTGRSELWPGLYGASWTAWTKRYVVTVVLTLVWKVIRHGFCFAFPRLLIVKKVAPISHLISEKKTERNHEFLAEVFLCFALASGTICSFYCVTRCSSFLCD